MTAWILVWAVAAGYPGNVARSAGAAYFGTETACRAALEIVQRADPKADCIRDEQPDGDY